MMSIWKKGIKSLKDDTELDREVDILIIGGGIAGITTLYLLSHEKKNVLLIDKGRIGFGVTSNTTGKITYLQDHIYEDISKMYDENTASQYLRSQLESCSFIKDTILKEKITCNYKEVDSYVFATKQEEIELLNWLKAFLENNHIKSEIQKELPVSLPCIASLKGEKSAVFHPLKYLYKLAHISLKRGAKIKEYVRAYDIGKKETYEVKTDKGSIKAKQVIVCTHYPFFVKPGYVPLKTHVESSYIVSSIVDECKPISCITYQKPVLSLRYHQDRKSYLLFASQSDKITKCVDPLENYQELEEKFSKYFKTSIQEMWSTHDIMPNDYLPLIGEVDDNLYLATGFQKWGMTNGTIAGILISDLILGHNNEYRELFSPKRKYNLKRCYHTIIDGIDTVKAMTISLLKKQPVDIRYENGKRIGVYTDSNGVEHKIHTLCPHMKCHLCFNEEDLTWECPCHGSKFDVDGNLLEGPSVFDNCTDCQKE